MTHSETELRKQSRYNHIQEMYRKWCQDSDLDPYIANPSNVLNFLAWGHSTKRWRSSTIAAYRAQILALFDDKTPFDNNDTFSQFFKILRANEPDTSTEVDLDFSPIITYLRSFPSIAGIMSLINVPPGHRLPKARAAGSTHAAKNGVSVDDIVAQGNWSSRRMFDIFYRLSSKTRSNFTDVVLG
jgi:hypothetical protein